MNDDREEEEENGGENCGSLIEEIEREIERAKKQTFNSHVVHSPLMRFGSDQEEEETTNKKKKKKEEDENNNENKNREERNRARREAVEWRRKKIEEKTFDPRAAFRERVKKKKNKNDENDETVGDDNDKWQSPSVVMRRRREKNVTVSTRKKSWTELETEWKLFEEKWKDSRGDDENENENEKHRRRRVLRFQDVPFPSSGAGLLTFLISSRGPFSEDENGRKKAKWELAKRWHPDKFAQKISRLLKDEDKEDVMEMVKEIYQSGTALMNTLSWDG